MYKDLFLCGCFRILIVPLSCHLGNFALLSFQVRLCREAFAPLHCGLVWGISRVVGGESPRACDVSCSLQVGLSSALGGRDGGELTVSPRDSNRGRWQLFTCLYAPCRLVLGLLWLATVGRAVGPRRLHVSSQVGAIYVGDELIYLLKLRC